MTIEKIQLTMTPEQAEVNSAALDLYMRLLMGQVGMVAELVATHKIPLYTPSDESSRQPSPELCDAVRDKVGELIALLGYSGYGHSLGVGNKHMLIDGNRAYEIHKVLAQALALRHEPPRGGGDRFGLTVRYTQDPAPEAKVLVAANADSPANIGSLTAEIQAQAHSLSATKEALEKSLATWLRQHLPEGSIIDLTPRKDLPEYLRQVAVITGSARGTSVFRIEKITRIDANNQHPELTKWVCKATPISEKTGKPMSGATGGTQSDTAVTLRGYLGQTAFD